VKRALLVVITLCFGALLAAADKPAPAPPAAAAKKHKQRSCKPCHTPKSWTPAKFAHERTGFPLVGSHARARCRACHGEDFDRPVARTCASCHVDVHAQQFGTMCKGCHTSFSWQPRFDAFAHRASNFPLTGRHAFLPCEECHVSRRDLTFNRNAIACDACHLDDYQRARLTTVDHRGSRFSLSCRECHQPTRFEAAGFPAHDDCFDLTRSVHSFVKCADCHSPLAGLAGRGTCNTRTVQCASCHEHRCEEMDDEHDEIAGYGCQSNKCYECHR
jgi:hypothetical protein